jgi:hypothetical protein
LEWRAIAALSESLKRWTKRLFSLSIFKYGMILLVFHRDHVVNPNKTSFKAAFYT